jgi:hypothetical protein
MVSSDRIRPQWCPKPANKVMVMSAEYFTVRDNGTGVDCADLGDGPQLVALQALLQNDQWTMRRTAINLNGTVASIGRSDAVTAASAQDPAVVAAQTIICGSLSIDQDGVQER